MSLLLEILKPDFLLHHAVYGSAVVGFVCPLVGVYFVLRRLVFWGIALPQVSTAGISFALMLQAIGFTFLGGSESQEKHLAIIASIIVTALAILVLTYLEQRGGAGIAEGRVGTLYAIASAATILFLAFNPSGESEIFGLLKGEIIAISESDFQAMLDVFALVAAGMLVFQKELVLVSFDRDMAVTLGRNVALWDTLLYSMVALTISLGVMTVGPLVIFGLLVLPPLVGLPWARGIGSLSVIASLVGGFSCFFGFYISYRLDLPLGPVIIMMAAAFLAVSSFFARLRW